MALIQQQYPQASVELWAMDEQVRALRRSLETESDSGIQLLRAFPELGDVCNHMATASGESAEVIISGFVRLFRTYIGEWEGVAVRLPLNRVSQGPSKTALGQAAAGCAASSCAQHALGDWHERL